MAVTLRYFTEFRKHMFQHITAVSSCGGIYAGVYCILYHVYDVVVKKVHVRYLISWWVSCYTMQGVIQMLGFAFFAFAMVLHTLLFILQLPRSCYSCSFHTAQTLPNLSLIDLTSSFAVVGSFTSALRSSSCEHTTTKYIHSQCTPEWNANDFHCTTDGMDCHSYVAVPVTAVDIPSLSHCANSTYNVTQWH